MEARMETPEKGSAGEKRREVLEAFEQYGIVVIVRGLSGEECEKLAEAMVQGGVRLMEITYDQSHPESWEKNAALIGRLAEKFRGRMLFGAGTVTTPELVDLTARAGGRFIISPDTDEAVIRRTREAGLVSIPGAFTPSEIKKAWAAGADFVKVFPASSLGPKYIKAVHAPLSQVKMLAVGSVNESNLADYLAAGAVGAGVGGELVNQADVREGKWEKLSDAAKRLVSVWYGVKQQRS